MENAVYLGRALFDVVNAIIELYETSNDPSTDLQRVHIKLDYVQRISVNLNMEENITNTIGRAVSVLTRIENNNLNHERYRAMLQRDGRRGRPLYDISQEQLSYLLERGFHVRDVAYILRASIRTVERRMFSFGLSVARKFSSFEMNMLRAFPKVKQFYWFTSSSYDKFLATIFHLVAH